MRYDPAKYRLTEYGLAKPIADSDVWLDVVCASVARSQSIQLAANELGVPVSILQRWAARIEARKAQKRIE